MSEHEFEYEDLKATMRIQYKEIGVLHKDIKRYKQALEQAKQKMDKGLYEVANSIITESLNKE